MSKSLGNTIAPQDVMKQSGADVLRLWVSMVDYREDIRARQGDPGARRRGVPQVPQRPARAAGEPLRLRSRDRRGAAQRGCSKSIAGRWRATPRSPNASSRRYDDYDYPTRLPGGEQLHHRGSERVLRRRHQGPDVHVRRQIGSAALRSDGDVPDRRWAGAAAGADSAVHDGRGVAKPARRRARPSVHLALFPSDLDGLAGRCAARSVDAVERRAQSGQRRRSKSKRQEKTITSNLSARVSIAASGALAQSARRLSRRAADAVRRLASRRWTRMSPSADGRSVAGAGRAGGRASNASAAGATCRR